ncbi:unnamed protein product [Camellia sinensis]
MPPHPSFSIQPTGYPSIILNNEEIRTEVCSTMKRPEFLTSKNSLKIKTCLKIPWLNCFKAADMDITLKALKLMETLLSRTYHLVTPEMVFTTSYGRSGSDKNNSEPEPKAKVVPRRDAPPAKPTHSISLAASAPPRKRQQKESSLDHERLASTRKRLHENYQETENSYFTIFWLY